MANRKHQTHTAARQRIVGDERRQKIASLYLRGESIQQIATQLKMSVSGAYADIERIRVEWRKHATEAIGEWLSLQLAKLDEIERAAWLGWERSLKEETDDAKFLAIAIKCVEQRSKLLKLDAPPDEQPLGDTLDGTGRIVEVLVDDQQQVPSMLPFHQFQSSAAIEVANATS